MAIFFGLVVPTAMIVGFGYVFVQALHHPHDMFAALIYGPPCCLIGVLGIAIEVKEMRNAIREGVLSGGSSKAP